MELNVPLCFVVQASEFPAIIWERIIVCLSLYCPWNYTVWCGPFTKDFLKKATALACSGDDAVPRANGFDIHWFIDMNLIKYVAKEDIECVYAQAVKTPNGK